MRIRSSMCESLIGERGAPARVFIDNGSEFSGKLLDLWAYHYKVSLDYSRAGKLKDNTYIESFNGSLHDECLTCTGLKALKTPSRRSKLDDRITMRVAPTDARDFFQQRQELARNGKVGGQPADNEMSTRHYSHSRSPTGAGHATRTSSSHANQIRVRLPPSYDAI